MDDAERAFRDALHRVDSVRIPVRTLEPAEVRRTPGRGVVMSRWLAAAAAVVVVAGLAVWGLSARGDLAGIPAGPSSPSASVTVTGTGWGAVQLYGKATEGAADALPFLEFRPDSTYHGGDPCNALRGTYRLTGDELRISPPDAMTEMGCKVTQQQAFMKALNATRRVHRDGHYLQLLDETGTVLAILQSIDGYPSPAEPTPSTVATPSGDPDTPTRSLPTPAGTADSVVEVRIRNASELDFEQVQVNFHDRVVGYGDIGAGAQSGYLKTPIAYGYARVVLVAAGKEYLLQPVDYVGESELAPGRYTYVLDLDGDRISLRLEVDG